MSEDPLPPIDESIFVLSQRPFSDTLGEIVARESLFHVDEFGRKDLLPVENIFEQLSDRNLTEVGKVLKSVISGRRFIDLGCGKPSVSKIPRVVAQIFGAVEYVGVDRESLDRDLEVREGEFSELGRFKATFVKQDMLAYLRSMNSSNKGEGIVFYLSGIEPFSKSKAKADTYIMECFREMNSLTSKGDAIVIGQATHGFNPENHGFDLQYEVKKETDGGPIVQQAIYVKR